MEAAHSELPSPSEGDYNTMSDKSIRWDFTGVPDRWLRELAEALLGAVETR